MKEDSVEIAPEVVDITGHPERKKALFRYIASRNSYIVIIDNDKE